MANYSIYLTDEFEDQLSKLNSLDQKFIEKKLENYYNEILKIDPFKGPNIKKLSSWQPPTWRIRIGNFRIFYEIDVEKREVNLITVDHRKDIYR